MDFELPAELRALQEEALDVGRAAAEQADLTEDTWIAAPDRTLLDGARQAGLARHDLARRGGRRRPQPRSSGSSCSRR